MSMHFIRDWFRRHFSDPQVVGLGVILISLSAAVLLVGDLLAPVIASLVIAYLLEGPVAGGERRGMPRLCGVWLVFLAFMAFLVLVVFGILPLLSRQLTQLAQQLPGMVAHGQAALLDLPARYPQLFSEAQVNEIIASLRGELGLLGQKVLSWSLASVLGLLTLAVYLVIMPLLVFFFLKDKQALVAWATCYLPRKRSLIARVWEDVDRQIGNYVRGKFIEILVIWVTTFITLKLLNMQFAMLLSVLVGLSVLIPYVGAVVVTLPVLVIAYFQWGFGTDFYFALGAYTVIQALDGNLLVPLLFSEVVNLHPVAIVVAILVFGGLWGFWGVFFAIPLATLVQAVLKAWPSIPPAGAEEAG